MQKVLIIDTSIMCCWLQIRGKDSCGPDNDRWDYNRVSEHIKLRLENGYFLVLPLATFIETGNHIANATGLRFEQAKALSDMLAKAVSADEPWAAFTEQSTLFSNDKLIDISDKWPDLAAGGLSIGDYLIVDVASYYASARLEVELLTGDTGLKAYEPVAPLEKPRRAG